MASDLGGFVAGRGRHRRSPDRLASRVAHALPEAAQETRSVTTRAQRAFALRLLAEAQRRLKACDVSTALEPGDVAALLDFTEEEYGFTGKAQETSRERDSAAR